MPLKRAARSVAPPDSIRSRSRSPWPALTARSARRRVELDAALGGEVEELLALGVVAGPAQEQPGEDRERDDGALGHHHHARGALVG